MIDVSERSGTVGATPRQRLTFLEDEAEVLASPRNAALPAEPLTQAIDPATAAAVKETRQAFFVVRDAGASNRNEQGQLLLKAQAQLAKYGTGTFTAMLLAPRPKGFGFRSATSAYELMAEAAGKPKRSHKNKRGKGGSPGRAKEAPVPPLNLEGVAPPPEEAERQDGLPNTSDGSQQSTGVSTPGRSNAQPAFLPINLDGASSPVDPVGIPDDQPATLDTSHTHTYVAFGLKGVYVPKADLEGFTTWLRAFSSAELSTQFLVWYRAAIPSRQKEESN